MDTLSELGVRIAMLTRKSTSHKLAIGKQACPPIEHKLQRERKIHRGPAHF
jgi:hypothetical protein